MLIHKILLLNLVIFVHAYLIGLQTVKKPPAI